MNLDIWGPLKQLSICLVCIAALVKKTGDFERPESLKLMPAPIKATDKHRCLFGATKVLGLVWRALVGSNKFNLCLSLMKFGQFFHAFSRDDLKTQLIHVQYAGVCL